MIIAQLINNGMTAVQKGFRALLPLVVLIILTLIGGAIFMFLEGPNEENEIKMKNQEQAKLLEETAFKLNRIRGLTPIEAYNHTVKTLKEFREELGADPPSTEDAQWTFWGAIYYAMTIYTTIGYGNIAAVTTLGRVSTIIYAFIGIPVALMALIALGGLFARMCVFIWGLVVRSARFTPIKKHIEDIGPDEKLVTEEASTDSNDDLLRFPVSFLIIVTILWILLCAWIFTFIETTWDFGTSLYFTLISFLTIGFGDVLPSSSSYIIFIGFLVLIGLSVVSTVLQIIQKQIEALTGGMKKSIDEEYNKALQEAHDAGEMDLTEVNLAEEQGAPPHETAASPVERADVEQGKESKKSGEPAKEKKPKNPEAFNKVLKRMPWQKRVMFHMMSDANRKQVLQHAENRSKYLCRGTQTDDSLMKNAILGSVGEPRVTTHDGDGGTVLWIQK